MRCIVCNTKNTLHDRTVHQGCCKKCEHRFAFEPATMQFKISDRAFADAISDVSANSTLFFTFKQLLYTLNRRLKRFGVPDLDEFKFSRFLLILIAATLGFFSWLEASNAGLFAAFILYLLQAFLPEQINQLESISNDQLDLMLQRWQVVGNAILKQLPEVITPMQSTIGTDVSVYSFDRVIVCDHAEIAQLLIANNVHFEHSCAVLIPN